MSGFEEDLINEALEKALEPFEKINQYNAEVNEFVTNLDLLQMIALWDIFFKNRINSLSQPIDIDNLENILIDFFKENNVIENAKKFLAKNVIKESEITKFLDKNNMRQVIFFSKFCFKNELHTYSIPEIFKNNLYIECTSIINQYNTENNIFKKIDFLNEFKIYWNNILLNKKDILWIDKNNHEQVEWAYHYIKKHITFSILNFSKINDYYLYVIGEIDAFNLGQPTEKILFLDKMRRAWSQKKFRDEGKNKKPYHLPLTKEAHKQLEFLSKILNKSTAQVLESIIRDKYQEYSDQKTGKNLY